MTLATVSGPPCDGVSQQIPALHAEVGDTLILGDAGAAEAPRTGVIVAVPNKDGSPPYRVYWLAGEYQSMIFPGPGARVRKGH